MTSRAAVLPIEYAAVESGTLANDAQDLLHRLRAGDPVAITHVYHAHSGTIRAFAKRLLGDADAAEELVHDVFVALPSAIRSFRQDAQMRTFLLSIAGNLSKNHIRSAIRKRRALASLAETSSAQSKPSPDPERAVANSQLAMALVRALDELPTEQRLAFVLCEVEERSAAEVAEIVGAKEATVRTRLFHAKQKMRELLATGGHL